MVRFYRPPQGKYSKENLKMAQDLGYKTFFWSLAYVDWYDTDQPTKAEAFDKLLAKPSAERKLSVEIEFLDNPFGFTLCMEDAISDEQLPEAEKDVQKLLSRILKLSQNLDSM